MKKLLLPILLLFTAMNFNIAQEDDKNRAAQEAERKKQMEESMKMEDKMGWNQQGAFGLDLGQLININPYAGAGSNRLGLGGAIGYNANYKKGLLSWKNGLLMNLSTQRIGSGNLAVGEKFPFEKALDVLTLGSNVAYKIKEGSDWAYSFDLGVLTQALSSYYDSTTSKIYLKDVPVNPYKTKLVSKFFSPAKITIAPGIKYAPNDHFYGFLSPVAGQIIYIADKNIANLGVHGTKLKDGSTTEYNQSYFGLGALAKLGYTNKFCKKLNFTSELGLFSDYLDNPQNIDVTWLNGIGVEIFKGLNVGIRGDLYYDDNKVNNITDREAIGGVLGTGKRPNFIEQLLITYNRKF